MLRIGDLELNQANHDVRRGSRSIQLSNKEYQLLVFLMRSPNKVQSRLEILHGVWGESFYGDDNLLDVYIRYLRQKVESPEEPKLIHTVRGVGFRGSARSQHHRQVEAAAPAEWLHVVSWACPGGCSAASDCEVSLSGYRASLWRSPWWSAGGPPAPDAKVALG